MLRYSLASSDLGWLLVGATGRGVCLIALGDEPELLRREPGDRFPDLRSEEVSPQSNRGLGAILGLIADPHREFELPLDMRGSPFQIRVWKTLGEIPPGQTATYTNIAKRMGQPTASRAVAGACAANHLAIVMPCHRVIRADGGLSGYRWGVERKRQLLDREAISANFPSPPVLCSLTAALTPC